MAIDPVRLARIRARVLAAATLTVPACGGGVPEHVNEPRRDPPPHINQVPADPNTTPDDVTTNTPAPDSAPPKPKHINTPEPDSTSGTTPPSTDGKLAKAPSTKDIPPPGQTINTAPAQPREPDHINTPPPGPTKANAK